MEDNEVGSGKTTKLMEQAVKLLGELPETHRVFITGAHSSWLFWLSQDFERAGLVNVEFFTPTQIINGALRGRQGALLIDDEWDLPVKTRRALWEEQIYLRNEA